MITAKSILIIGLLLLSVNVLAADFNRSIVNVLKHEGFLVYDKDDPGGITNYGISFRYLKNLVKKSPEILELIDTDGVPGLSHGDVSQMKIEDAIHIYRVYWWDALKYKDIKSQALADKIFDMSVNMGPTESHVLVARAYQKLKNKPMRNLMDINRLSNVERKKLLASIREEQSYFYRTLASRSPKSKKFLAGWLKRAAA